MQRYISLLRGVNVRGYRPVPMAKLSALVQGLGYSDVKTYLQSGNVVFRSDCEDRAAIGSAIEKAIERALGFPVTVVMRGAGDLKKVIAKSPYVGRGEVKEAALYVTFLQSRPEPSLVKSLVAPDNAAADEFRLVGNEVYLHCPGGYGRTKLSNMFFEKKLKVAATTRNWKTVNALFAIARGVE